MKIDFTQRSDQTEIMDDLEYEGPIIEQTLHELDVINKWLGGNQVTLGGIKKVIHQSKRTSWHIADLGCGGGEMLRLIARWGNKKDIQLQLTGIDANPHVTNYAKNHSKAFPEINYNTTDILSAEFQQLHADIFIATLFLHHFTAQELTALLKSLARQTTTALIINDIHRHPLAYHSINLITSIFSKSPMVKNDAGISVLRAFTKSELEEILIASGFSNFQIKWKWAFRWQVVVWV